MRLKITVMEPAMQEKSKTSNPYYPDIPLFLILIPGISAINYYLTYSNIQLNGFLLLTFSLDTLEGYLALLGVRTFILYLDKRKPYKNGMLQRIGIQLAGTVIIGLLIISLLTELVSWVAKGRPAPLNFYTHDLFIIGIWFFVVNGIYIGLYFYREWQHSEAERQKEQQGKLEGFVVTYGKKDILLTFEELAGFFVDSQYVSACTRAGKTYYLDESMDKVEKKLPAGLFFRLNRQFTLHRDLVTGFKRAENGKIVVLLHEQENFPSEIPVSRTKAPAFKSWFRPE